jgi:REP element-mobilizing transposase RayT
MPSPPRPQSPGATYHVTTRGNRKQEIFSDDQDRLRFLQLLEHLVSGLDWRCHTYCLMTNHYHLLVETPRGNISEGMHYLNGVYAKWFNWRHEYEGHVFERRFRGGLVEGASHLLELTRYIVLNPVRAGLAGTAGTWRWSSYNATVGARRPPPFLTRSWVLSLFSDDPKRACELYAKFVADGVVQQRLLGHDRMPGTRPRPGQPYPYAPGKRSASRLTSSAAGRPTTFR